jgi:mono/diheme cytochrome c family protein
MSPFRLSVFSLMLVASAARADPDAATSRPDPAMGQRLAQQWCAGCHVIGDDGIGSDAAPTFRSIAQDPKKGPDYLRAFLAKPHRPMPAIPLGRTEIEDLVAYIGSLSKRP